jgi:hypothetical protein
MDCDVKTSPKVELEVTEEVDILAHFSYWHIIQGLMKNTENVSATWELFRRAVTWTEFQASLNFYIWLLGLFS